MTRKIGVFDTQQQAIEAIQQLEQAGFVKGELKVLAKDSEHSRRIEAESDVHVDELHELEDASDHGRGLGTLGFTAAAGSGGTGMAGAYALAGYGTAPYIGGGYLYGAAALFDEDEHEEVLQALGLDDEEAHICNQALQSGSIIVVVETDDSKSLLDKEGGPDLSRLSTAEAVFRNCNASAIAAGA
ncbi:MAG: general stress protein [Bacillota bacterium]